jgi:serine/threonine protein kinase
MTEASPSMEALLGEVSSSKFKILRLLGAGGMGAVFEAEHLFTKRTGALKLMHSHFAQIPEAVERFTREASAAGRIQNPHIVETFDAGRLESGQPYMFMELLAGTPLDTLLQTRGALSFEEAIGICAQAAAGLAAAHKSGIIHRDIKPANLFLVEGRGTLVKILDFGISKFAVFDGVSKVTQEGTTLGTPYYMPPEQVMGSKDIDEGADIYALGVVLYECVTGQPPYVAETLPALSVRIYEGHYIPVSELRNDTPPGFDRFLARSLAVDRQQRYATAQEQLIELLSLVGRHAESMAPTLMAGSPMPMLSVPPPYLPSQPPVRSAAPGARASGRPSASERALAEQAKTADFGDENIPARNSANGNSANGNSADGNSADGNSADRNQAGKNRSERVTPNKQWPWLWPSVAAAAIAVSGYLAFGRGGGTPAEAELPQVGAGTPAAVVPTPGVVFEPAPEATKAADPATIAVSPSSEAAASSSSTQRGASDLGSRTPASKSSSVAGAHDAPHASASSSVRSAPSASNIQEGLKRENPFDEP